MTSGKFLIISGIIQPKQNHKDCIQIKAINGFSLEISELVLPIPHF